MCRSHYIDCLIKELGIDNSLGNPTYTPTTLTKEEILENHRSVLCSFEISTKDEELDLPSLYWIPKLHKCPFKQRYIAGSAKCSTKPLSKLLTCILSAVKTGLQSYCDTIATWGVVWIRCGFFDWQHICYAWWTCFSIDSRHPYGYKLFSSSRWLVPLFIHLYEADFIQGRLKKNEKKIARSFNFTFRYIDNVLSLNKSTFGDFVDHIYPIEL